MDEFDKRFKPFNSNGFTLIETIIAMGILAIGLLGVASMQFSVMKNNKSGNLSTQANMLAQFKIEELKNNAVTSSALTAGSYSDANNPIDSEGEAGGIYTRSWDITNFGDDARNITVTVQWTPMDGRERNLSISAVTRGGGF